MTKPRLRVFLLTSSTKQKNDTATYNCRCWYCGKILCNVKGDLTNKEKVVYIFCPSCSEYNEI